jgi:transposase
MLGDVLRSGRSERVHLEDRWTFPIHKRLRRFPPVRHSPPLKRQRRSLELKRQIVEETLAPGTSVARVARAHGVNANQVFAWRRQYQQGLLKAAKRLSPGLLAVRIAEPGAPTGDTKTPRPSMTIPSQSVRGSVPGYSLDYVDSIMWRSASRLHGTKHVGLSLFRTSSGAESRFLVEWLFWPIFCGTLEPHT